MRHVTLVLLALFVVCACDPSDPSGPTPSVGCQTPEDLFLAQQRALANRDPGRFWELLSTGAQSDMTTKFREMIRTLAALPESARRSPSGTFDFSWLPESREETLALAEKSGKDLFVMLYGSIPGTSMDRMKMASFVRAEVTGDTARVIWTDGVRKHVDNAVLEGGSWRSELSR